MRMNQKNVVCLHPGVVNIALVMAIGDIRHTAIGAGVGWNEGDWALGVQERRKS